MTWTGHLLLPDSKRPTIEDLVARLRELRKVAGEYIISQAAPGTIPETRYFDPNNCCCLDFDDKYPSNAPWPLTPSYKSLSTQCCREDPSRQLFPVQPAHDMTETASFRKLGPTGP